RWGGGRRRGGSASPKDEGQGRPADVAGEEGWIIVTSSRVTRRRRITSGGAPAGPCGSGPRRAAFPPRAALLSSSITSGGAPAGPCGAAFLSFLREAPRAEAVAVFLDSAPTPRVSPRPPRDDVERETRAPPFVDWESLVERDERIAGSYFSYNSDNRARVGARRGGGVAG
ncbi:hypothetical protein THAOC_21551, partial [Thalassiosira oceanica]